MSKLHNKSLLLAALLLILIHAAPGTILRIDTVSMPLYLHGSDSDPLIVITPVPIITHGADPEWRFSAISMPFTPPGGSHDVNLTTLYGIVVSGGYKEDSHDVIITIDASKAAQPESYPFTLEQVIDAVTTCVKLMYPPRPQDEGKLGILVIRPNKPTDAGKPVPNPEQDTKNKAGAGSK